MTSAVTPAIGDQVLIGSYLINTRVYGYVVPGTSTQQFTATYEIVGDQGSLTLAAVIGPEGPAGADMFVLNLQTDAIDQPADLPETLQNSTADIGKTWLFDDVDSNGDVIGSSAYVWYGTSYRRMMFGQPGPPGPVPIITPQVNLIAYPGNSYIAEGGTPYEPTMMFNLAVPPGPTGPAGALALCPDVDFVTNPPQPGDVLGYQGGTYSTFLSAPTDLTPFAFTGGGTMSAGTYYWVVTAITGEPFGLIGGESLPSNEVSTTVGGSTSSVMLEWIPVQGAVGYNVYRTTIGGVPGSENRLVGTVSAATSNYLDTGTSGSLTSPPLTNTAEMNFPQWVPVSISQLLPSPYSMPESAFTAFTGHSIQAPIGTFALPPQPFAWTPIVWGHIGADALRGTTLTDELGSFFGAGSGSNVLVGCEVLLGDPTAGQMIGRGFGNNNTEVNIMPHYSTSRSPGVAISPNNNIAVVPANHSNPAQGTLYINLYNDGRIGQYKFTPLDCQLLVMVVPVTERFAFSSQPPAYDTSGQGAFFESNTGASTVTGFWTHTASPGAAVVVAVGVSSAAAHSAYPTTTMTYDGAPMTSLGFVNTNSATKGWVQMFGILDVAGGPQQVGIDISGGSSADKLYCVAAQSISYTNVNGFGPATMDYGTSKSPLATISAGPDELVVQAFAATNHPGSVNAGAYSGTSRYNQSLVAGSNGNLSMVIGDTGGSSFTSGVTFLETLTASCAWGSVGVPLFGGTSE